MSERAAVQARIEDWLCARADHFNAPYGVLAGLDALPRGGKVRTVTFGIARWLDATLTIWSPTRLTLRTSPGWPDGEFHSAEEFFAFAVAEFAAPENLPC
jgi:hypothetical protein